MAKLLDRLSSSLDQGSWFGVPIHLHSRVLRSQAWSNGPWKLLCLSLSILKGLSTLHMLTMTQIALMGNEESEDEEDLDLLDKCMSRIGTRSSK